MSATSSQKQSNAGTAKFANANLNAAFAARPANSGQQGFVPNKAGLLVLKRPRAAVGKISVPKPVNLPSIKKEHAGNDPSTQLVPSGTGSGIWSASEEVKVDARGSEAANSNWTAGGASSGPWLASSQGQAAPQSQPVKAPSSYPEPSQLRDRVTKVNATKLNPEEYPTLAAAKENPQPSHKPSFKPDTFQDNRAWADDERGGGPFDRGAHREWGDRYEDERHTGCGSGERLGRPGYYGDFNHGNEEGGDHGRGGRGGYRGGYDQANGHAPPPPPPRRAPQGIGYEHYDPFEPALFPPPPPPRLPPPPSQADATWSPAATNQPAAAEEAEPDLERQAFEAELERLAAGLDKRKVEDCDSECNSTQNEEERSVQASMQSGGDAEAIPSRIGQRGASRLGGLIDMDDEDRRRRDRAPEKQHMSQQGGGRPPSGGGSRPPFGLHQPGGKAVWGGPGADGISSTTSQDVDWDEPVPPPPPPPPSHSQGTHYQPADADSSHLRQHADSNGHHHHPSEESWTRQNGGRGGEDVGSMNSGKGGQYIPPHAVASGKPWQQQQQLPPPPPLQSETHTPSFSKPMGPSSNGHPVTMQALYMQNGSADASLSNKSVGQGVPQQQHAERRVMDGNGPVRQQVQHRGPPPTLKLLQQPLMHQEQQSSLPPHLARQMPIQGDSAQQPYVQLPQQHQPQLQQHQPQQQQQPQQQPYMQRQQPQQQQPYMPPSQQQPYVPPQRQQQQYVPPPQDQQQQQPYLPPQQQQPYVSPQLQQHPYVSPEQLQQSYVPPQQQQQQHQAMPQLQQQQQHHHHQAMPQQQYQQHQAMPQQQQHTMPPQQQQQPYSPPQQQQQQHYQQQQEVAVRQQQLPGPPPLHLRDVPDYSQLQETRKEDIDSDPKASQRGDSFGARGGRGGRGGRGESAGRGIRGGRGGRADVDMADSAAAPDRAMSGRGDVGGSWRSGEGARNGAANVGPSHALDGSNRARSWGDIRGRGRGGEEEFDSGAGGRFGDVSSSRKDGAAAATAAAASAAAAAAQNGGPKGGARKSIDKRDSMDVVGSRRPQQEQREAPQAGEVGGRGSGRLRGGRGSRGTGREEQPLFGGDAVASASWGVQVGQTLEDVSGQDILKSLPSSLDIGGSRPSSCGKTTKASGAHGHDVVSSSAIIMPALPADLSLDLPVAPSTSVAQQRMGVPVTISACGSTGYPAASEHAPQQQQRISGGSGMGNASAGMQSFGYAPPPPGSSPPSVAAAAVAAAAAAAAPSLWSMQTQGGVGPVQQQQAGEVQGGVQGADNSMLQNSFFNPNVVAQALVPNGGPRPSGVSGARLGSGSNQGAVAGMQHLTLNPSVGTLVGQQSYPQNAQQQQHQQQQEQQQCGGGNVFAASQAFGPPLGCGSGAFFTGQPFVPTNKQPDWSTGPAGQGLSPVARLDLSQHPFMGGADSAPGLSGLPPFTGQPTNLQADQIPRQQGAGKVAQQRMQLPPGSMPLGKDPRRATPQHLPSAVGANLPDDIFDTKPFAAPAPPTPQQRSARGAHPKGDVAARPNPNLMAEAPQALPGAGVSNPSTVADAGAAKGKAAAANRGRSAGRGRGRGGAAAIEQEPGMEFVAPVTDAAANGGSRGSSSAGRGFQGRNGRGSGKADTAPAIAAPGGGPPTARAGVNVGTAHSVDAAAAGGGGNAASGDGSPLEGAAVGGRGGRGRGRSSRSGGRGRGGRVDGEGTSRAAGDKSGGAAMKPVAAAVAAS